MKFRTLCLLATVIASISTVSHAQRMVVEGEKLLVNGQPVWLNAANTPWNAWNDFGGNYSHAWWDAEFTELKRYGANGMRTWITCNGDGPISIDENGFVTGLSAKFWTDLDDYFALAEKHQIYVMATLMSFDHTITNNKNFDQFRKMYNSDAAVDAFVNNYVIPFVNRYKGNPYLCMIEPCNEIEWVNQNADRGGIPWDRLQTFVGKVAAAVHKNSKVLVTLGCNIKWQSSRSSEAGNFFTDALLQQRVSDTGVYLDVYSPHFYDWALQWHGNPFDNRTPADYALGDKPAIIGECPANASWVIYENAYKKGWGGVYAWTSNGVDVNGSLETGLGAKLKTFYDAHTDLIDISSEPDTSTTFTITLAPVSGGTIALSPQKDIYSRNDTVWVVAAAIEGKAFASWTGISSSTNPAVIVVRSDMTVGAVFIEKDELITNGTFALSMQGWSLGQGQYFGNSSATATVSNNELQVGISAGGSDPWHVQLTQTGIALQSGLTYELTFQARADAGRSMFVAVGESEGSYTKFGEKTVNLTTSSQTISIRFTMSASVANARVEFNMGQNTSDVFLSSISLKPVELRTANLHAVANKHPGAQALLSARFIPRGAKSAIELSIPYGQYVSAQLLTLNGQCIGKVQGTIENGKSTIPIGLTAPNLVIVKAIIDGTVSTVLKVVR